MPVGFRQKLVIFAVYKTPLHSRDSGSPFGGQVPPTKNHTLANSTLFRRVDFFFKVIIAIGYEALGTKGLSRKCDDENTVKRGLK